MSSTVRKRTRKPQVKPRRPGQRKSIQDPSREPPPLPPNPFINEPTPEEEAALVERRPGSSWARCDYAAIEKAARNQCTDAEIAAKAGISYATFRRRKDDMPGFKEFVDHHRMVGLADLRERQMGDTTPTMKIFLGKVYLGQREARPDEEDPLKANREMEDRLLGAVERFIGFGISVGRGEIPSGHTKPATEGASA